MPLTGESPRSLANIMNDVGLETRSIQPKDNWTTSASADLCPQQNHQHPTLRPRWKATEGATLDPAAFSLAARRSGLALLFATSA